RKLLLGSGSGGRFGAEYLIVTVYGPAERSVTACVSGSRAVTTPRTRTFHQPVASSASFAEEEVAVVRSVIRLPSPTGEPPGRRIWIVGAKPLLFPALTDTFRTMPG